MADQDVAALPVKLFTVDHGVDHLALLVAVHGAEPVRCCGYSWCRGKCGLPAFVIPAHGDMPELKAYSNMTACGPVMQRWRVEWQGPRVEAPSDTWEYLMGRWWQ